MSLGPFLDTGGASPLGTGSVFDVTRVVRDGQAFVAKHLRPSLADSPVARRALEREAATLTRLAGRHAPRLVALERSGPRGPWLLEEFASGASLRARIEGGGALPTAELDLLARAAFTALAEVHAATDAQGPCAIVHGDLQPDHVFWDGRTVTFIDFGMARYRGMSADDSLADERGTVPFVAPEVLRGEAELDGENDVFALAATLLYAALGFEPMRDRSTAARLVRFAEEGVAPSLVRQCPTLSTPLRLTLEGALAFERGQRRGGAAALAKTLAR